MMAHSYSLRGRKLGIAQLCICALLTTTVSTTMYILHQGQPSASQRTTGQSQESYQPNSHIAYAVRPFQDPELITLAAAYDTESDAKSSTVPRHPIMILQHDCLCADEHITELAQHSIAQLGRYAAAHGYIHRVSTGQYVPNEGWAGRPHLNKVHLALQVILEELAKGEDGVTWVMLTDVDTLLSDPSIPLHLLLPDPNLLQPTPIVIGNRDVFGFNDGVITFHVSHRTVTFLARVLAIEYHTVEPHSSLPEQPILGTWNPSDQYAIALALQHYRDAAAGFYEVPQLWWNSYQDPSEEPAYKAESESRAPGEEADENELGEGSESLEAVRLRVHLAGSSKYERDWKAWLVLEEEVWAEAARLARNSGVEGTGIELMPKREKARRAGEAWWKSPKNGIDTMVFNAI